MKRLLFLLTLTLVLLVQTSVGQTVLGKHPADQFAPAFWTQHTNAASVAAALNATAPNSLRGSNALAAGSVRTNELASEVVALLGQGSGAATNIVWPAAGAGLSASTNGLVVTFSLYTAPAATLANNQGTVEIGATVASTVLTWTLTAGAITWQSLDNSIGEIAPASTRTTTHTSSYTTDRTYTLTYTDGVTTNTSSSSVTFLPHRYWGVSASATLTDAEVRALNQDYTQSRSQTRSLTTSASYFYFAWPAAFGAASSWTVDGFADDGWTLQGGAAQTVVNASGYSQSYYIYRHTLPTSGTYSVTVN